MKIKYLVFVFMLASLNVYFTFCYGGPTGDVVFQCSFEKSLDADCSKGNSKCLNPENSVIIDKSLYACNEPVETKKTLSPFIGAKYASANNINSERGLIEIDFKPVKVTDNKNQYLFGSKSSQSETYIILNSLKDKYNIVFTIVDEKTNFTIKAKANVNIGEYNKLVLFWDDNIAGISLNEKLLALTKSDKKISLKTGEYFYVGGMGGPDVSNCLINGFKIFNNFEKDEILKKENNETVKKHIRERVEEKKEYIADGGFEECESESPDILKNWGIQYIDKADGICAVDKDIKFEGACSLMVQKKNGPGTITIESKDKIYIAPGKEYRFVVYYHAEELPNFGLYNANIFLIVEEFSKNSKVSEYKSNTFQSTPILSKPGQWRHISLYFTPKSNTDNIKTKISITGNPSKIWLDNASLKLFSSEDYKKPFVFEPPAQNYAWEKVVDIIKERNDSNGEIRKIDGKPYLLINDKVVPPVFLRVGHHPEQGRSDDFYKAGIDIQMVTINIGRRNRTWLGKDNYNFDFIESKIKFLLQGNPNIYLVPVFSIGPYPGWDEKYPDDVCQDQNGLKAFGGDERYYFAKEKNSQSDRGINSYYSKQWRNDAKDAITATMKYFRNQPYYKAIVGFSLCGGHDGQWLPSSDVDSYVDYCPAAVEMFKEYMKEKYKDVDNLRKVLNNPAVTFEKLYPPAIEEQKTSYMFREPGKDMLAVEYSRFLSDSLADMLIGFGDTIKKEAGKKVFCTTYYADTFYGGHRNLNSSDRLMNSYSIDIIHTVTGYNPYRQAGGPGVMLSPVKSFSLHNKLWLEELDFRTFAIPFNLKNHENFYYAPDIASFQSITEREMGGCIATHRGAYYYDMGGCYFNDSSIMREIEKIQNLHCSLIKKKDSFKPDVAVVIDNDSFNWLSKGFPGSANLCVTYSLREIHVSGVPYDLFYLSDLLNYRELQNYKMYIFLNTWVMSKETREFIVKNLQKEKKTLVWLYAPGYIDNTGKSVKNIRSVTGIDVYETKNISMKAECVEGNNSFTKDLPPVFLPGTDALQFVVDDKQVLPFAKYSGSNDIAGGVKIFDDWQSVYVAYPCPVPSQLINNIAKFSKAYVCTDAGVPVFVNDNFISVHGVKGGKRVLKLPRQYKVVKDALTKKTIATNTDTIEIDLPLQETRWFVFDNE